MSRASSSPLIAIVGPTASGKTDLALALAATWPVEILVADSRQVYRGMDVGTAKPDSLARERIPHHLIDLVAPADSFSVARWVELARAAIPEIAARGRIPMVVGGTGLYLSALLDGHDYGDLPWSRETRRRLTGELAADGLDTMARRLAAADPGAAAYTDIANPRRVLRALERVESGEGGHPSRNMPYAGRVAMIGLSRPRDEMARRIDSRTEWMFAHGLLDEVRRLLTGGMGGDSHPMTGHGYGEAARVLAGEWSLEEAISRTALRTRQYAKRQLTWFRRDSRIVWIRAGSRAADDPALVAEANRVLRAALS